MGDGDHDRSDSAPARSASPPQAEQLLEIQRDLGEILAGVSELAPAVEAVLDAMLRFEGLECGGIYVIDRETAAIELVASRELSEQFVEAVRRFTSESANAALITAGKAIYRTCDKPWTPSEVPANALYRREGIRAIGMVPILHRGKAVGCLNAASRRTGTIPESSRQALEAIASRVGMAIARIRAEEDLRESEEMLRAVYDNALDGILLAHAETKHFHDGNRAIATMLGYSMEELLTLSVADIHPVESLEYVVGHFEQQAREGGYVAPEIPVRRKDGSVFYADVNSSVVTLRGERFVIGIFRDVTDRRLAQRQLLETQRLESIGVLAGGIAHDFNNLLMGIEGNLSLARLRAGIDDEGARLLSAAELATHRARDLTRQLLTFAKGGAPVRETVSVASMVRDPAQFVLGGSPVRLQFQLPDDLWAVEADRGQIAQVMQNLVLNAADAMPNGGEIAIVAENVELAANALPPLTAGRWVRILVRDDGVGIPPEDLSRIFDPYFTTKETGSGLGLAVCYSIVAKHGGHIDAQSRLGHGATFSLTLPAAAGAPVYSPEPSPVQAQGAGDILVMDDDGMVARVVAAMLESLGYRVSVASDGAAAVRIFRDAHQRGERFVAVILDLTVPGGAGGVECAAELLAIDPDAPLIVSSGYSNDPVMAHPKRYGFRAVLAKPYRAGQLQEMLNKLRAR